MPEARLLCCVSDSAHAVRAVEFACRLSGALARGLTFILINQLRPASGYPAIRLWPHEEAQRIMDSAVRYARSQRVRDMKSEIVEAADIAASIIEYSRTHDIEHIVVGTGNPPFLGRLLIGSVSEAIVSGARCSVTVAR